MRLMRRVVGSAIMMALAALPLLSSVSGCSQQKPVEAVMPPVNLPDLETAGLHQVWQRHLSLEAGEHLKDSWRVGDSIYISSTRARLFRIEAKSGVLAWAVGLGEENFQIYRPIELPTPKDALSSHVLVVTRGEGLVLDMATGDVKQQTGLGISVTCDPTVVGNTLAVGCTGRFLGIYLDRLSGRRWTVASPGELFESAPVVIEDDLVLANRAGQLWRISAENGSWKWKDRKVNGEVTGGLAIDSRAVYIPCLDQRVYAFASDTGGALWDAQLEGVLDQPLVLAGNVVLVTSGGRGLFAVTKQNGSRKWETPGIVSIGTVIRDHIWATDDAGNLKCLSLDTGEILSSTPVPAAQMIVRNAVDNQVIVANRSGMVGAYTPR
jgi:outer membrane protein assembly factor BamB